MKALMVLISLIVSTYSMAGTLTCETREHKVILKYTSEYDIKVILGGETTLADGIVTAQEVDLVARFPSQGEMTIYARVGKSDPGNYMYLHGKRNPVICR